jgi:uncharacterized protein YbjT (DUF2867 family)
MTRTAIIAGSTGLVGSELLNQLSESGQYSEIIVLVRKPCRVNLPNVRELIVDFDKLEDFSDEIKAEHLYICLGSTMKKAKTQENFRKIDVEYPIKLAEFASKNAIAAIAVISSMGANSKSSIFYNRMKGLMEEGISNSGIKSVNIFRPSLLLGKRKEFRFGEKFAIIMVRPNDLYVFRPLKKYRP